MIDLSGDGGSVSYISLRVTYTVVTTAERNFELKWRHVAYALWATGETWHGGVDSSSQM